MPSPRAVEIIAHRGASRDRLENTLGAFREALVQGADAFELDVHATRDGVVVVHHDPVVRAGARLGSESLFKSARDSDPRPTESGSESLTKSSRDSDPNGPPPLVAINTLSYADLRLVTLANGELIPSLDEVLELAEGKATVYVEIKGVDIEKSVVECLARHPATVTAVHSFDHRIPQTVGHLDSRVPLGILSSSYVIDTAHLMSSAGARDLWQHTALVDQELIDLVHAAGARMVVWTENNVDHARELVQMGVDAICTDIPGAMRAGLADAGLVRAG